MDFKIVMGNRVKMFREQRNMSQEELAIKLNYSSKTSISKIESGEARIPTSKIFDFADALGVSVDDLLMSTTLETSEVKDNASELASNLDTMQNILRMLANMDSKKLTQIESIIKTFVEE